MSDTIQNKKSSYEKRKEEKEAFLAEIELLKAQVKKMSDYDAVKKQLESARNGNTAISKKNDEVTKLNQQLSADLKKLQTELGELQKSNKELLDYKNSSSNSEGELQKSNRKLLADIQKLQGELDALQKSNSEEKASYKKLLEKNAELQESEKQLQDKLALLQAKLEKLQQVTSRPNSIKRILQRLGSFLISPELGFLTFLFVLVVQVAHNASLFQRAEFSPNWFFAIIYAIGVDLFALILTIHFEKKQTLKVFAFAQFILNILYYQVWLKYETASATAIWEGLTTTCISALLAFVIFSYGELFTKIIAKHIQNLGT